MEKHNDFDSQYDYALEMLAQGITPDMIKPPIFKEVYIEKLKEKLRIERFVDSKAHLIGSHSDEFWYHPSSFNHYHWDNYKNKLRSNDFPERAIEDIDTSTTKILKMLAHPNEESFEKHGLVIGYVQSGKTANYTGLLAKAIDCGYRNIIILSGIHNSLRNQTQTRIEKDLYNINQTQMELNIQYMTNKGEKDFDIYQHASLMATQQPKIFIIKKNWKVLENILSWFSQIDENFISKIPTIIIDDEADNATIDVSNNPDVDLIDEDIYDDFDDNPSLTNKCIKQLRNLFYKVCYIGYTATPFANVLIEPNDDHPTLGKSLYPRDFIISLPKPEGYCGIKELFPSLNNFDYLPNQIADDKVYLLDTDDHEQLLAPISIFYAKLIPTSLKKALFHFLITAVLKRKKNVSNKIHSFLIHVNHEIEIHSLIKEKFLQYFDSFKLSLLNSRRLDSVMNIEIELFSNYLDDVIEKLPDSNLLFTDLRNELKTILNKIKILDINSKSDEELDFSNKNKYSYYIVIGGNRLSRGLTIEGLTVSYFTRSSKLYDSFLQMGRWFGFRPGYEKLVRIFTTTENYYWFNWLNEVEEHIRTDIARYEKYDKTPLELAVRIKTHPGMFVTSPLKMKNVREFSLRPSLNSRQIQTKDFDLSLSALVKNINILNRFIGKLSNYSPPEMKGNNYLWRAVSKDNCCGFIKGLRIPDDSKSFHKLGTLAYIDEIYDKSGELSDWSVLLANPIESQKASFDIAGFKTHLSNRLKHRGLNSSPIIRDPSLLDIDLNENQTRENNNPLMIIHLIDGESTPSSEAYEPWFAAGEVVHHLVGLVIVFPNSNNVEREDYVSITGVSTDVN